MLRLAHRFVTWRWYVPLVLAIWVLSPEVRRVYDWRTTFHSLSPFSLLPLASLVPGFFLLRSQWSRFGVTGRRVMGLWTLAFGYAFMIAYLQHSSLSAIYAAALFVVPLFLYALLSAGSSGEDISVTYERIAKVILWLAVFSSLYGIYQYIAPPAWDVYWAQQANIEGSQGITESFNFRIFGTLNSTGPFAGFLVFAILMNLPRLRLSRWWNGLMLVPCIIALALTSVRAGWLAVAVGIILYLLLSPQRRSTLMSLGTIAVAFALVGAGLLSTVGFTNGALATNSLTSRVSSLQNLSNDSSVRDREAVTAEALHTGIDEPLGQGIGVVGTSAKLSGGQADSLDNGYLARFLEMGVPGTSLYLLAILVALFASFKTYRSYLRSGNGDTANIGAIALTVQLVLMVLEVGADSHNGFAGMLFWMSLFFASAYRAPAGVRVEPPLRTPYSPALAAARTSPA